MSQYFGQPELPPNENFVCDTQTWNICINGRTDAHCEESLRNNTESIIQPAKNDKDKLVLKCTEKENNNIKQTNVKQDADVEICADVVRSRQNVSELQTIIIETIEQKRYNQLFKSVPAVTPIYFVKENEQNLLDYHVKSFKSNEKLENNLLEMRTVIKGLDTCIKKNPIFP